MTCVRMAVHVRHTCTVGTSLLAQPRLVSFHNIQIAAHVRTEALQPVQARAEYIGIWLRVSAGTVTLLRRDQLMLSKACDRIRKQSM